MKAQLSIVLLLAMSWPAYWPQTQEELRSGTHQIAFAQSKPEKKGEVSKSKKDPLPFTSVNSRVNNAVAPFKQRPEFVGMAVGVITGKDRYQFYYGKKVKGKDTPPDHNTLFAIGSVSKTFTATLLALYNHRGLVRIPQAPHIRAINGTQEIKMSGVPPLASTQSRLRDLLPARYSLANPLLNVTLEQLADHHSGLPKNPEVCSTGSLAADIDCLFKQLSTCYPSSVKKEDCHGPTPLTGDTQYSNYAFAVLSHLLAPLHGRNATWIQALRDEILGPMGMQSTNERAAFLDSACYAGSCGYDKYGECNYKTECNETFSKRAAVGYLEDGSRALDQGSDEAVKGGSGVLWSTLDDQLTWLGYNMGLKYDNWKKEMIDILPDVHTARDGTHGLAWETETWDGDKVIKKGGAVNGFHAFIAFNPSRGTGVVVLVNSSLKPEEIAQKILAVL